MGRVARRIQRGKVLLMKRRGGFGLEENRQPGSKMIDTKPARVVVTNPEAPQMSHDSRRLLICGDLRFYFTGGMK